MGRERWGLTSCHHTQTHTHTHIDAYTHVAFGEADIDVHFPLPSVVWSYLFFSARLALTVAAVPVLICAAVQTALWELWFLSRHSCWKRPEFSRDARITFQKTGWLYSDIWNNPGLSSSSSPNAGKRKWFWHIAEKMRRDVSIRRHQQKL